MDQYAVCFKMFVIWNPDLERSCWCYFAVGGVLDPKTGPDSGGSEAVHGSAAPHGEEVGIGQFYGRMLHYSSFSSAFISLNLCYTMDFTKEASDGKLFWKFENIDGGTAACLYMISLTTPVSMDGSGWNFYERWHLPGSDARFDDLNVPLLFGLFRACFMNNR